MKYTINTGIVPLFQLHSITSKPESWKKSGKGKASKARKESWSHVVSLIKQIPKDAGWYMYYSCDWKTTERNEIAYIGETAQKDGLYQRNAGHLADFTFAIREINWQGNLKEIAVEYAQKFNPKTYSYDKALSIYQQARKRFSTHLIWISLPNQTKNAELKKYVIGVEAWLMDIFNSTFNDQEGSLKGKYENDGKEIAEIFRQQMTRCDQDLVVVV